MYGAVRSCAATSEAVAVALTDAFLRASHPSAVSLAANALQGLADLNAPRAHRWALDLADSPAASVRRAGIAALGWISYADDVGGDRAISALDALARIAHDRTGDEGVAPAIAQAFGELAKALEPSRERDRAVTGLLDLMGGGDPHVRYVGCRVAWSRATDDPTALWVREVLEAAADTPAEFKGVLHEVDHGLHLLAATDPEWVARYLRLFVQSRDYGAEGEGTSVDDLFSSSLRRLVVNHKPALESELTRWLASGEGGLQRAAGDVIADLRVGASSGHGVSVSLDPAVLRGLNDDARCRAAFAVLGYVLDGESLSRLLVSLIWESPSPTLLSLVADMLGQAVLYDYPGSGRATLVPLAVREDTPGRAWAAIAAALSQSHAYYYALHERPHLKEMEPPDRRLHQFHVLDQERDRQIREQARSQSVIGELAHTVPLKQGRSWFTEQDGQLGAPSRLGTISTEVEVPRSLLNDPLGHQMRRVQWRQRAAGIDPEAQ